MGDLWKDDFRFWIAHALAWKCCPDWLDLKDQFVLPNQKTRVVYARNISHEFSISRHHINKEYHAHLYLSDGVTRIQ